MRLLTGLCVAVFCITIFPKLSNAQRIAFDDSANPKLSLGDRVKWDPYLERLIEYHDNLRAPTDDADFPAVRVTSSSGEIVSMYPLKDFPRSVYVDILDVAGAPNGDIVLFAFISYVPRNVRPHLVKGFLLTYDQNGILKKVWDTYPYDFDRVVVDPNGNVFGLGGAAIKGDYPLLVKYSPSGEVLGEYLSSALFPTKDMVMAMNNANGEPKLFIQNGNLYVWIPTTLQIYAYSLDGNLLSVTSLSQAVQTMNDLSGSSHVRFLNIGVDSSEEIICQVGLFLRNLKNPHDLRLKAAAAMARLRPDGSFDAWIEHASTGTMHVFLGLTKENKPVLWNRLGPNVFGVDLSD